MTVRFRSTGAAPGFLLLDFDGVRVDGFAASVDEQPRAIRLRGDGTRRHELWVHDRGMVDWYLRPQAFPQVLDLSYRVALEPGGRRLVVPIPVPAATPEEIPGTLFTARLSTPPGTSLADAFPSDLRPLEESADGVAYRVDLPAVPSHLAFDLVEGEAPPLTWLRAVDALVVVLLLLSLALVARQLAVEGR